MNEVRGKEYPITILDGCLSLWKKAKRKRMKVRQNIQVSRTIVSVERFFKSLITR